MMNDEGDIHEEQLSGFKGMESIVLEEMWILFNESSLHLIWG